MPMFRLDPLAPEAGAELLFEGQPLRFWPGETVAGVLMAAGITSFRETPASGAARGPWCLMGVCFDCLVSIDGRENQRACMVPARAGMQVRRQIGARRDAAGTEE
ncbi:(2Fe-2S)-binding protein [Paracoccus methylovorus]|uniref:(2Fe-2S)-binding protein n=2 Tax=Paracoccaceae TaxID=31989 RepID=A0ABX7JNM9_9RHOB|nr:(2Fe-2S)-binding protein [Paracoccus methylovorus]